MTSDNSSSIGSKVLKGASGLVKGIKSFDILQGYKYVVKIKATGSSVVRVLDTTLKGNKNTNWIFRIDKAHGKSVPFEHVNINPKFSGLKRDPHLRLPSGSTQIAQSTAKTAEVLNKVNKVGLTAAVVVESAIIAKSAYDDVKNGTTRNSVVAVAQSAGGWTGGLSGGAIGAAIGSALLPGIGTIVLGMVGSVAGGIGGALGVGAAVEKMADSYNYGMEHRNCLDCGNAFQIAKYKGENRAYCQQENCMPSWSKKMFFRMEPFLWSNL